jgi:hypothetical protein
MKKKLVLPKLPEQIAVRVRKGSSGCLLAELPEYKVFTEAEDLNNLFLQVNDLIYTYFDVPRKFHDQISFMPPLSVRYALMRIAKQKKDTEESKFRVNTQYSPDLYRSNICA